MDLHGLTRSHVHMCSAHARTCSPSRRPQYVTTWLALDPTRCDNGTLVLLPGAARGHSAHTPPSGILPAAPAARPCVQEPATAAIYVGSAAANLGGCLCARQHGVIAELEPGDVLVFTSETFHTSGPNCRSVEHSHDTCRRVHLAQYSREPILWERDLLAHYEETKSKRGPVNRSDRMRAGDFTATKASSAHTVPPVMFAVPCA